MSRESEAVPVVVVVCIQAADFVVLALALTRCSSIIIIHHVSDMSILPQKTEVLIMLLSSSCISRRSSLGITCGAVVRASVSAETAGDASMGGLTRHGTTSVYRVQANFVDVPCPLLPVLFKFHDFKGSMFPNVYRKTILTHASRCSLRGRMS